MKVTDIWKSSKKPVVSFELFPAKTEEASEKLDKTIDALIDLKPAFFSVTFGAGGSTREGSYQLVEKLLKEKGTEVIAYFAGYGLGPDDITAVLDDYEKAGVENVLVVRGDPPREEGFTPHPQSMNHANELLEFIRPEYGFCLGAAAYPEGHIEAESLDKDMEYIKQKVDSGAEYIISNYFYDNAYFFNFSERLRSSGVDVPIIPGIMPIYSVKMMNILAKLCGATITEEVKNGIASLPQDDREALVSFGIDFAVKQCRGLIGKGVPGLHIYTMDREASAARIVNCLKDEGLI